MKESEKLPSLEALGENIRRLHEKVVPKPKSLPQGMNMAMRVGLELVSGVLVGAGAGIVLDRWLGTSPILLLICFFLGTAAGFLTMYRTVTALTQDEFTDESDKET